MISFAHKYDVPELLDQCEAYLVEQLATPNKVFSQQGDAVRWTMLAEKCELSTLLAHCELFMAEKRDGDFWSHPAENTMQLSGDSMRRMLKVGAWHRRNGEVPPAIKYLVKWQPGGGRAKRKAEDDLQDDVVLTLRVTDEQTFNDISIKFRSRSQLSKLFTAYKRTAISRRLLSPDRLPSVQFIYAGSILNGTESAEDLGLDNNEEITAIW